MHVIPADVLSRTVDDEEVLLTLSTQDYFGLNSVGTRIWNLLKQGRSIEQISQAIVEEFEVSQARADQDIAEFLHDLEENKLLLRKQG